MSLLEDNEQKHIVTVENKVYYNKTLVSFEKV